MNGIKNYKNFLESQNNGKRYLITGKDRAGKRFKIFTRTPYNYNIYQGSIWRIDKNDKKIKLIERVYN